MTDLGKRLVGSAAAILIGMSIAHAQGKLSEGAILKSLAGAGEAARAANLNIDALRRDVEKRIQEEGTAEPRTTTQCSERWKCFCSESLPPG